LLALYFFQGLRTVFGYFEVRKALPIAMCAALALSNLVSLWDFAGRQRGYPPGWVRYFNAAEWVRANSAGDAVALCRKPFLFYLFSNRRTVAYPFTRDHDAMRDYLVETAPDYIVIENFGGGGSYTGFYVVPVLQKMAGYFEVVHVTEEPETKVLSFSVPSGSEGP
jgi:hypothetical protein